MTTAEVVDFPTDSAPVPVASLRPPGTLPGRAGRPEAAWMVVQVSGAAAVAGTSVAVAVLLSVHTVPVVAADPAIRLPPRSGTPRRRRR